MRAGHDFGARDQRDGDDRQRVDLAERRRHEPRSIEQDEVCGWYHAAQVQRRKTRAAISWTALFAPGDTPGRSPINSFGIGCRRRPISLSPTTCTGLDCSGIRVLEMRKPVTTIICDASSAQWHHRRFPAATAGAIQAALRRAGLSPAGHDAISNLRHFRLPLARTLLLMTPRRAQRCAASAISNRRTIICTRGPRGLNSMPRGGTAKPESGNMMRFIDGSRPRHHQTGPATHGHSRPGKENRGCDQDKGGREQQRQKEMARKTEDGGHCPCPGSRTQHVPRRCRAECRPGHTPFNAHAVSAEPEVQYPGRQGRRQGSPWSPTGHRP